MQKSTDEEKMVLLLQTIQKSEDNVRKVSFNAAYTLYGKRDGAVIFIPDIWIAPGK